MTTKIDDHENDAADNARYRRQDPHLGPYKSPFCHFFNNVNGMFFYAVVEATYYSNSRLTVLKCSIPSLKGSGPRACIRARLEPSRHVGCIDSQRCVTNFALNWIRQRINL